MARRMIEWPPAKVLGTAIRASFLSAACRILVQRWEGLRTWGCGPLPGDKRFEVRPPLTTLNRGARKELDRSANRFQYWVPVNNQASSTRGAPGEGVTSSNAQTALPPPSPHETA